ncbi:hypothetical protein MANES_02G029575v8 [Manihot esculenta]|uniref:Uncharacterized protein n=1 Tax=Manihot esculenta TaxID=3983 RepID=A0ACC8DZ27_MANES|nr:hypothetical protein MANES_02G029575v8 [Manihot esculenta]
METARCKILSTIFLVILLILPSVFSSSLAATKKAAKDLYSWYQSFLLENTFSSNQPRLLHSYRHVATGFAAKLTANEVKAMATKEGFVSARPERFVPLHTTHTPSFLRLQPNMGLWNSSNYGRGVIIGLIHTGITPDHPSFSGEGMPPPPAKWKGKCELNGTSCNNKLIAGTVAGSPVQGANYFGQANGTSIGMAPLAHLAMYKVSARLGKAGESEILAATDAAIEDGVDVLSLSLGIDSRPFYDEVIALGAYAAVQKGIVHHHHQSFHHHFPNQQHHHHFPISNTTTNFPIPILKTLDILNSISRSHHRILPRNFLSSPAFGIPKNINIMSPKLNSLSNEAPWILTVGASTVDRAIRATVLLGNNPELNGESLYQPESFPSTLLPLVYAGANGNPSSASCNAGSLTNVDVKGKIVLCEGGYGTIEKGLEVKRNGGTAMIVMNDGEYDGFVTTADPQVLPASHVRTVTGLPDAPQVAEFSSRGPSIASPGILKPDIIGPGVRILAAWPVSVGNTTNKFDMISGTSMSCPQLSGVAALLNNAHPDWSPAAIKSAIMTTANLVDLGGKPIYDEQFDIQPDDYIPYLCGLGYSDKQVGLIVRHTVNCSTISSIPEAQLNYPAFSIRLGSTPQTCTRTITNAIPDKISFNGMNQKATYSVTFSKYEYHYGRIGQGYLNWVANGYNVRTPIAVTFE